MLMNFTAQLIWAYSGHIIALSYYNHGIILIYPDSKIHGASMGPTWVLSAPDVPHVGPMNPAIRVLIHS